MSGAGSLCTLADLPPPEGDNPDSVKVLRLTLQNDLPGERPDQAKEKPIGRAFAMVANRPASSRALASEYVKSNDGDEEIIKVYLRARVEDGATHEKDPHRLKNESGRLQELPLEKHNMIRPRRTTSFRSLSVSQDEPAYYPGEDISVMRETTKRLFSKLQEAEKRHQSDRAAYETSISHYRREAERSGRALRQAEQGLQEKDLKLDELQRLLTGMEKEHQALLQKMNEGEAELERLRSAERDKQEEQERSAKLEKEVAALREKIHHLDDMLKSQQRKVRQMIEQLQNSKTVIQSKDAIIQELKERVAYLEAEQATHQIFGAQAFAPHPSGGDMNPTPWPTEPFPRSRNRRKFAGPPGFAPTLLSLLATQMWPPDVLRAAWPPKGGR